MESAFLLRIKVNPRSARDRVVGWLGGRLKVSVSAPPEKGRANAAVLELLASVLGVARSRLRVVAGESASEKVVAVLGLSEAEVLSRLSGG